MGLGGSTSSTVGPLPAPPQQQASITDQAVQLAQGSALRSLAAKRGLASTFVSGGGSVNDTPTPSLLPAPAAPGPGHGGVFQASAAQSAAFQKYSPFLKASFGQPSASTSTSSNAPFQATTDQSSNFQKFGPYLKGRTR